MSVLHDAVEFIQHLFVTTSHTVLAFLKPFALAIEQGGEAILIAAAENAVQTGFSATGSGAERMAAALKSFEEEVVEKGKPFMESQARTLIEIALQNAKVATTTGG
jgi:hypothetical protein